MFFVYILFIIGYFFRIFTTFSYFLSGVLLILKKFTVLIVKFRCCEYNQSNNPAILA